jgi:hypothetical protein
VGEASDYLLPWAASAGRISASEFMMLDADLLSPISPTTSGFWTTFSAGSQPGIGTAGHVGAATVYELV